MKKIIQVHVHKGDKYFVAECIDLPVVTQGKTLDELAENLKEAIVNVKNFSELKNVVENKKIALTPLCSSRECEDKLKFETGGTKVLNIDGKKKAEGKCVVCNKEIKLYFN